VSGVTPVQPRAGRPSASASWVVREATHEDIGAVACAVRDLLLELGGKPASRDALEEAARTLVEDPTAGVLLVADSDGVLTGLLGASWQHAVRIPGRYGLIQELWIHPSWRGRAIGGDLVAALIEHARKRGIGRLEVGLPSERFPHLAATEAFYVHNGFAAIGTRMRRLL
jgi:GNAT superfamily N-acetyltransferase